MTYNFDEIQNRKHTNSLKWDVSEGELPMWVADMDFKTAPAVIKAMEKKLSTGIFGYQVVPEAWYEAIQNWWRRRHQFEIQKEWLIFCTGVVPAITSSVKRLTNMGDQVLVQTPVYDIFFHSIENTGRHVVESPLSYSEGQYQIDYEALEQHLAHPLTTMMILCNPHNPAGKVWTKEELSKIGELCKKYHVTVLSDEIHCDLIDPGRGYIPFASASETCKAISMTCISASKAFNIAGLQSAAVIIPNEALRQKVNRGLNSDELAEPNVFATEAVIAAFSEGEEWLDALNQYIYENKQTVMQFIEKELPQLRVVPSHATYLLWIEVSQITEDSGVFTQFLRKQTGLYLSEGAQYRGNGKQFVRMNVACPRVQVMEGLKRFKEGVISYENR